MILLDATLSDEEVLAGLGRLLEDLGGEWHLEEAARAWRAEQMNDGLERLVGLVWCDQTHEQEGWLLSWDVVADIPEDAALFAMLKGIGSATLVLSALVGLGQPVLAFIAGPLIGAGVFRWSSSQVLAALPDTTAALTDLEAQIRASTAFRN